MSSITLCDWCHKPIEDQTDRGFVSVLGGGGWGQRDFHSDRWGDGVSRDCLAEWCAMVELAEHHREVLEAVTHG